MLTLARRSTPQLQLKFETLGSYTPEETSPYPCPLATWSSSRGPPTSVSREPSDRLQGRTLLPLDTVSPTCPSEFQPTCLRPSSRRSRRRTARIVSTRARSQLTRTTSGYMPRFPPLAIGAFSRPIESPVKAKSLRVSTSSTCSRSSRHRFSASVS